METYQDCVPLPESIITSLRAFGYDLPMAIADLIDNSIYARAKRIIIDYDWNNDGPWIRITDDGTGMDESVLHDAMRLGSRSALEPRDQNDLGRFGLGLKTASFSQARLLTVVTKTDGGRVSARCWDLDHIVASKKWQLGTVIPAGAAGLVDCVKDVSSGTIVLWQKLDRIFAGEHDESAKERFLAQFSQNVTAYLEMVFHSYLEGRNAIELWVGRHKCKPWDPFLLRNIHTQQLSFERLDNGRILVTPYVLPHVSKRTIEDTLHGGGIKGWNAQQGFYVYRNRRMIISGGYLDFDLTPEEHFKLCRIRIDLSNDADHEWSIDVRKASASPPVRIRNDLQRIAKATRSKAVEVYRARLHGSRSGASNDDHFDVWLKKRKGDKIAYRINKNHPVIKSLLEEIKPPDEWTRKLFHIIERTVPHRLIIQDNAEHEDCHVNLPPDLAQPPVELMDLCRKIFLTLFRSGKPLKDTLDYTLSIFDDHVAYRATLDRLMEEMGLHE